MSEEEIKVASEVTNVNNNPYTGEIEASKSEEVLISKDVLSTSNCCRLCGLGAKVYDKILNDEDNPSFIPLFENYEKLNHLDRLDKVVNRYLPIEVFESDIAYPRVICSLCLNCLDSTIKFFNKITEGQFLLSKILNTHHQKVTKKGQVFTFAENNPVVKAPKKRGRPRKTSTKANVVVSSDVPETFVPERRAKRQSRPPARYVDDILPESLLQDHGLSDDDNCNEFESRNSNLHIEFLQPDKSNEFDCNNGKEKQLDSSTTQKNLMNTDILMQNKTDLTLNCNDSSMNFTPDGQEITHNRLITVKNNSEEIIESDEKSDGDATVKLSDLLHSKRKPVKRKRKYKKRIVRKNVIKIQCEKCPKSFNHSSSLIYHIRSFHNQTKNFTCPVCNRAFSHKQLLNNHMYVHSDEKYFECESCPAKFKSRASLYTHKKSIHSAVKEFTCEECGLQFNLKSSLKGHIRLHTGEKPFQCEFCQKKFAQRSNLREHRRTHTKEKPYHCTECNKSFTTASQLRSHRFSHTGQKVHLCQICGKGFSHTENFKYHMRRHAGERPLECPICKKQFAESWSLKKHYRIHTGDKPYNCSLCNKVFSDPSNFAKHKKMHLANNGTESEEQSERLVEIKNASENAEETNNTLLILDTSIKTGIQNPSPTSVSLNNEGFVTRDEASSSIVQILSADDISYEHIQPDDQQHVEQVIYVYSGDGPLFTFAMTGDGQQSSTEANIIHNNEEAGNGGDRIHSIDASYDNANSVEFESHYYSLETVGGNTIAVPIVPINQTNSRAASSSRPLLADHVAMDEISAYLPESS